MQVRGNVRRKNVDAAFALSDHADWDGLLRTVEATGATKVFVTHGFQEVFSRYLNEKGIESYEVKTAFKGEEPPPPAEGEEDAEKNTEE
jgi:putative mRNA 3-end processing factor